MIEPLDHPLFSPFRWLENHWRNRSGVRHRTPKCLPSTPTSDPNVGSHSSFHEVLRHNPHIPVKNVKRTPYIIHSSRHSDCKSRGTSQMPSRALKRVPWDIHSSQRKQKSECNPKRVPDIPPFEESNVRPARQFLNERVTDLHPQTRVQSPFNVIFYMFFFRQPCEFFFLLVTPGTVDPKMCVYFNL